MPWRANVHGGPPFDTGVRPTVVFFLPFVSGLMVVEGATTSFAWLSLAACPWVGLMEAFPCSPTSESPIRSPQATSGPDIPIRM